MNCTSSCWLCPTLEMQFKKAVLLYQSIAYWMVALEVIT